MQLRYYELKEIIYIAETLLGVLLLLTSAWQYKLAAAVVQPASHVISAIILFVVGVICIFFGVETFLLRDDPEIWL